MEIYSRTTLFIKLDTILIQGNNDSRRAPISWPSDTSMAVIDHPELEAHNGFRTGTSSASSAKLGGVV